MRATYPRVMTNSDDPRERSWEDGTANPPPDPYGRDQPTQSWQQYPDQPTQQYQNYPPQQYQGYQQYPDSQPYPESQPYPDQPTQQYGYPQYAEQQPNPTQALPPYDPNQQYGPGHQYTQSYGPPQNFQQPQYQPQETGEPPTGGNSSRKVLFALLGLAALVVVVLAGVFFVTNQPSSSNTASAPTTVRPLPTTLAPLPTPSLQPSAPPSTPGGLVPGGIPEILGNSGAAIGTVTAIDGSNLTLQGIDGAPVTVLTTPATQVLSLSGFDLSALKVGSRVVVNGSPAADGAITADIIVETP